MAWTWDSAAKVEATASGTANNDVQVDMNVGTTADNRLLVSTAGSEDDRSGMDISTTWTYNGVNMTKPSTYRVEASTGYANVAMLAYMNDSALPTDGLAHPLRAVFDNPTNGLGAPYFELSGQLYHGVKQAAPTDVQTVSNTSATSVTTPTITVASAGSLVVGAAQFWDYAAWNDVTGQNERSDFGITTTQHLVTDKSADANTTLTADNSGGSGRICLIAASWEQASGAQTKTLTVTLDSALKKLGVTKTAILDAALQQQGISLQTTLDAALRIAKQLAVTADAALQGSKVKTATLDSALQAQRQLQSALDAALQKALQLSVTLDAVLQDGSVSTKTLTTTLDAAVKALRGLQVTADAAVKAVGVLRQTTLDAAIQRVGNLLSLALDAVIQRRQALQVVLDAAIQGAKQKDVVLDSALVRRYALTLSLDAQLVFQRTLAATLDAAVKKLGYTLTLTVDAFIRPPDGVWPREGSVGSSWMVEGDVSSSWTKEAGISSSWTKG